MPSVCALSECWVHRSVQESLCIPMSFVSDVCGLAQTSGGEACCGVCGPGGELRLSPNGENALYGEEWKLPLAMLASIPESALLPELLLPQLLGL